MEYKRTIDSTQGTPPVGGCCLEIGGLGDVMVGGCVLSSRCGL
ncbi:MAG: hypothetical protein ACKPGT_14935 [Microcystis sp.]